jgi:undecaprenyl-diphosphatase
VLVPGEIGIVLGGVLANQHKLPLVAVLIAAVAGAIIGDSIGYWVGKRYGEWILRRIPNRILDDDKIDRAEQTVRRYGGRAVFVGRFTAALRALVPGTAGMSGVRYGKFLLWNVAGGSIWAVAYVLIGYLAGSQYQRIEKYANYIGIGLLVVIAAVLIVRHRRAKSKPASTSTR